MSCTRNKEAGCVFLKSTSFAFPSLWEPPWTFDLVPIFSTISQDIIPKFPFPSLPTEQYSTSPDMSANFSGNLCTDHKKLNIFKIKVHSRFPLSASHHQLFAFFCLMPMLMSTFLFLHLQLSCYLHASHTSRPCVLFPSAHSPVFILFPSSSIPKILVPTVVISCPNYISFPVYPSTLYHEIIAYSSWEILPVLFPDHAGGVEIR